MARGLVSAMEGARRSAEGDVYVDIYSFIDVATGCIYREDEDELR